MKKITLTQIILGIVAVLVIAGLAFAGFTQGQKDKEADTAKNQTSQFTSEEVTNTSTQVERNIVTVGDELPEFSIELPEGYTYTLDANTVSSADLETDFVSSEGDQFVTLIVKDSANSQMNISLFTNQTLGGVGMNSCYPSNRIVEAGEFIIVDGSYPESGNVVINYNAYPKSSIYQKGDAQFEKLASRTSDHYDGTAKNAGEVTDGYQCVNALKRFVTKNISTNPVTSETYIVSGIGVSFELNGDTVPEGFVEVLKSMKGIEAYDASPEYNIPAA